MRQGNADREQAGCDHTRGDECVDAADERGCHLPAMLVGRDVVQLLLGVQERDAVPGTRDEPAGDEERQRVQGRRDDEDDETEGDRREPDGLAHLQGGPPALRDDLRRERRHECDRRHRSQQREIVRVQQP